MIGRKTLAAMWTMGAISSCQDISIDQLTAPSYESQLAEHLSNTGAKMYGAYWCPHCALQKQAFGHAVDSVPYIECDARGVNPQVDECNAVGIAAYPTWLINGEVYVGRQSLNQLAVLSSFEKSNRSNESNTDSLGGFSPAQ